MRQRDGLLRLLQRIVDEVGATAMRELLRARAEAARREGEVRQKREELSRRAKSETIDRAVLSDEAEALRNELKAANIQAAPLCDLIDVREGLEEWRNAVEAVRNAREAMILMEGGRYLDAVRVQRRPPLLRRSADLCAPTGHRSIDLKAEESLLHLRSTLMIGGRLDPHFEPAGNTLSQGITTASRSPDARRQEAI
ncbi:hypothetical protein AYJ54_38195 [Bradyrhizobium centrolobii]|uniref:Uncharacterized protein n=2 Tax=Bradyrhizobium TaxID=374 RepID=A0A176ZAX0_9BRAD|nr:MULTISPECIES: hypothetical protein [Bradyrhizobium]OAF16443.1 hypothetical protein AYJ54_38195 [Bradyrhizobium centrolobii]OAF16906.1 hypothetical protein AXW67_00065 [Bradyrhizobium neotropicale]